MSEKGRDTSDEVDGSEKQKGRRRSVAKPGATTPMKERRKGMAASAQPERPRAASVQEDKVADAMTEVEWSVIRPHSTSCPNRTPLTP